MNAHPDTWLIPARFNGPRTSANGGWAAGGLAQRLRPGPVSVSLRAPVPLDRPLMVQPAEPGRWQLLAEGLLLAEAEPADPWAPELPHLPEAAAAEEAGALARWRSRQRGTAWPYAHCFACGFAREDGLQIIPGPVGDPAAGTVATTWVPPAILADDHGQVLPEATWAALDCSAGIAWSHRLGSQAPMVTARMTVELRAPLRVGERLRVVGWPIAQDGRKLHAGTAIVDDAGQLRAHSRQLWVMPREAAG